ncbi:MAG: TIGR03905 family TSCPD domain-containing protein [Bacilli bacterium]
METLSIKPQNVCSREMIIDHENGVIVHARFVGGCAGNLQAIARLIEGMSVERVVALLTDIKCPGSRTGNTSCPDQLAQGLKSLLK